MKYLPLIVLAGFCCEMLGAERETRAELKETSTPWLPSRFFIQVQLARELPAAALNASMFRVEQKKADKDIRITSVTYAGFSSETQPATYSGARIYGDFTPTTNTYVLTVFYPGGSYKTVDVVSDLPEAAASESWLNRQSRNMSISVEPFIPDGGKSVGFKYDFKYHLPEYPFPRSDSVKLSLSSDGEISSKKDDPDVQNAIRAGLGLSYLKNLHFPVTLPPNAERFSYAYPLGFQIKPAEMEMNRDFEFIDYTGKILAGGAIPYLDYPVLLWSRAVKHKVSSFPPTFFLGYSARKTVEEEAPRNFGAHRLESELIYHFPLSDQLEVKLNYRSFYVLKAEKYLDNVDVGVVWYIDSLQKKGISLSYQSGELPPEFKHTDSVRFGFIGKF